VSNETLVALYRYAAAFVYLSTYEGFGMPPLEAMACGTPVLAAAAASIPEVLGDAALLIEPAALMHPADSVAEIRQALERLATDPDLRETLRARGLRRAAQFSWEETARRTLEVILSTAHS